MAKIIKNTNSHVIATGVEPDAKKRMGLSKVPESEAWLFKNPEALESVKTGLKEAAEKRYQKLTSTSFRIDRVRCHNATSVGRKIKLQSRDTGDL